MTKEQDNIQALEENAIDQLKRVISLEELERWRIAFIGRKGAIPMLLRTIKELPEVEKKVVGQRANAIRKKLEAAYKKKELGIRNSQTRASTVRGKQELGVRAWLDGKKEKLKTESYPPSPKASEGHSKLKASHGHLHPLTLTIRRIQDIFAAMGFMIVEGPEVEESRLNFDQLNIPLEHPARAETDTFYVKARNLPRRRDPAAAVAKSETRNTTASGLILRTQTSPVQIRAVLENNLVPPFKILSPGRVFRAERTDATHETTFYQFEGLEVGSDISVATFKGVIETFYSTFFEEEVRMRLRPGYFPFVEPGLEVDMSCVFCKQKGCRVCENTGWVEMMGAGMVHPNVLRNMNVDPAKYQGYAFGGAVDRLAMLRYGIDDIRLFWSGDIRFLKQFS